MRSDDLKSLHLSSLVSSFLIFSVLRYFVISLYSTGSHTNFIVGSAAGLQVRAAEIRGQEAERLGLLPGQR